MYKNRDLIKAHNYSINHRAELSASKTCGCFYCLAIFNYEQIKQWCDDNNTALCPKCGIDSVFGSKSGYKISIAFLSAMRRVWF